MSRDRARARPPRTMVLIELPPKLRPRNVARQDTGIEIKTAIVARTFLRKRKIIKAVKHSPMVPSLITFFTAILTNTD